MIVKSKYDGYGEVEIKETEHNYDFIAYVENNTDKTLKLYVDDLEGWYSEPIVIYANDWVEFLADEEGRCMVESIMNGDFKAVLEDVDNCKEKTLSNDKTAMQQYTGKHSTDKFTHIEQER